MIDVRLKEVFEGWDSVRRGRCVFIAILIFRFMEGETMGKALYSVQLKQNGGVKSV